MHLLGGPRGCKVGYPRPPTPQDVGRQTSTASSCFLAARWEIFKPFEVFPRPCFPALAVATLLKNGNDKNKARVFLSMNDPKKHCCKETRLVFLVSGNVFGLNPFSHPSVISSVEMIWGHATVLSVGGGGGMRGVGCHGEWPFWNLLSMRPGRFMSPLSLCFLICKSEITLNPGIVTRIT